MLGKAANLEMAGVQDFSPTPERAVSSSMASRTEAVSHLIANRVLTMVRQSQHLPVGGRTAGIAGPGSRDKPQSGDR
jgi:hypothetical protein